ncbi:MAG: nuclear transport factor 2 family protein [Sphingomicrobium sp.]
MAGNDCQLIEQLENEWRDALCTRDMARLRSLVHPDFVLIGTRSSGPFQMHRDEWLDAIQRREVDAIALHIHDATVLDEVLIGTVHARWQINYLGRKIEDCVLLTDVWVREDGRWQAIRRHSTPAPAGECPNLKLGE